MTKPFIDEPLLSQLEAYDQLLIGYSGGLDSTVLLHALASSSRLKGKLLALHVNHGLSPHAMAWQTHCEETCKRLSIPIISKAIQIKTKANLEEVAREGRYAIFSSFMENNTALVLGHHQNDQAETLLLHLFRGAGVDGLSAMPTSCDFASGQMIRPLLEKTRTALEEYAKSYQLDWIEDESNQQLDFSRNYIRHALLPLIEKQWPKAVASIARTAAHCQQARQNLDELAELDGASAALSAPVLDLDALTSLSQHRIANLLRVWLKNNKVRMPSSLTFNRLIDEVILAKQDALPLLVWGENEIRRYQNSLYLLKKDAIRPVEPLPWLDFPEPIQIPGLGHVLAQPARTGLRVPDAAKIEIKFRQGGELIQWHGQRKQLKKLFQEWQIPTWLRDQLPLLYINDELALVPGYAISDSFYAENMENVWLIEFSA